MKFTDLAIEENGNMLVLVTTIGDQASFTLTRCTATGEPLQRLDLSTIPAALRASFTPVSLHYQPGMIVMLDPEASMGVVLDAEGLFLQSKTLPAGATMASAIVPGNIASGPTSGGPSLLKRLLNLFYAALDVITKPSSLRNRIDSVKSPFSRNGLLINGIGNNFAEQD